MYCRLSGKLYNLAIFILVQNNIRSIDCAWMSKWDLPFVSYGGFKYNEDEIISFP